MRSAWIFLSLTLALAAALSIRSWAQSQPLPEATPFERDLLFLANEARAQHRLPPLSWNSALATAARDHATRMLAEPGELQHQYRGEPDLLARISRAGAHLSMVAENLGRGATAAAQLQDIWMRSPVHRANLLDPRLTVVGIGVLRRDGVLYAVEDFGLAVPVPRREEIEAAVADVLRRAGLPSVEVTVAARATCALSGDIPAGARLVIQWDGSFPQTPPDALLQQISRGVYHAAAVGACPSRDPGHGFTTYRVASLLF